MDCTIWPRFKVVKFELITEMDGCICTVMLWQTEQTLTCFNPLLCDVVAQWSIGASGLLCCVAVVWLLCGCCFVLYYCCFAVVLGNVAGVLLSC